jgi:histidyl-tRNA synthetase
MLQHELGAVPTPPVADVLVLPMADGLDGAAARVGRICRAAAPTGVDYSARSLRAKMRAADRSGARWAAIMNAEEAERRVVQLKELASGVQREVAWDDLPAALAVSEVRGVPEARG